jgi:hypothetical protein
MSGLAGPSRGSEPGGAPGMWVDVAPCAEVTTTPLHVTVAGEGRA